MNVSRPVKLTHGQTILYEIDMFRFSAGRLFRDKLREEDRWVFLEDFLLHYRNLVDFLGDPKPRNDELHISKPEFLNGQAGDPAVAGALGIAGTRLWKDPDTGSGIISQYLHHSTVQRIVDRDWPVGTMNDGLEKLLVGLDHLLRAVPRQWRRQGGVAFHREASNSTTD
jgi:hypothetical protein